MRRRAKALRSTVVLAGLALVFGLFAASVQANDDRFIVIEPKPAEFILHGELEGVTAAAGEDVRSATQQREERRQAWRENRERRMNELADRMNLSQEQREQMVQLREEATQRYREMRNDPQRQEMPRRERRAAFREGMREYNEKVTGMLNPRQQEQWNAHIQEQRERHGRGRGGRGR